MKNPFKQKSVLTFREKFLCNNVTITNHNCIGVIINIKNPNSLECCNTKNLKRVFSKVARKGERALERNTGILTSGYGSSERILEHFLILKKEILSEHENLKNILIHINLSQDLKDHKAVVSSFYSIL